MKSNLVFQSSAWFTLVCLLLGIAYAFLLYQKKSTLNKQQNFLLGAVRAITVALLCFLFLNPLLQRNKQNILKPIVVLAIDNSTSMLHGGTQIVSQLVNNLGSFTKQMQAEGLDYEVKLLGDVDFSKDKNLSEIAFNEKKTDLSALLSSIKSTYEGQNLSDVILLSDGIANEGVSPTYSQYDFKIHTVGVGDTTRKMDIRLIAIYANRIAYLGNEFPVQAEVGAFGFEGKGTTVVLKQNGQVLDKQIINFAKSDEVKQITFKASGKKLGIQRFTVEILPLSGEQTTKNNSRDAIVEVVEGKEKVLLVALAPHPDIKALKAIVEKNDLYELEVKILSSDPIAEIGTKPFDALILHQVPDVYGQANSIIPKLIAQQKPTLFILGSQSNMLAFNGMQQVMSISGEGQKSDRVTASFNNAFTFFNLDNKDNAKVLGRVPPMNAPFGQYNLQAGSEVVLYQRIGSVTTNRPLLAVNTSRGKKTAVLAGEGLWQWRMEEYDLNESHAIVDEFILKTIQLISAKEDKRKLRVYPIAPQFSIDDKVILENEIYNDINERVYNQNIHLELTDEQGVTKPYDYTISQENSRFEISGLKAGVYHYKASSQILKKTESVSGQFVVSELDLEAINTTADFNMLRTLSAENNGKFVEAKQLEDLLKYLSANKSPDRVISTEALDELINLKWLLFLLLFLATLEWGVRKYLGSY